MISEMTGTYSGTEGHSGERVVIDGENVIKFNIDKIFHETTDDDWFWEYFSDENWNSFDMQILLEKEYVEISTDLISANVKNPLYPECELAKTAHFTAEKRTDIRL